MKGCTQCNISTFDSRGSKEYHNKKWHKTYTLKLNNTLITVSPDYNANGFVCYLKSGHCQEVSQTIEQFVDHLKHCTGTWTKRVCIICYTYKLLVDLMLLTRHTLLQSVKYLQLNS